MQPNFVLKEDYTQMNVYLDVTVLQAYNILESKQYTDILRESLCDTQLRSIIARAMIRNNRSELLDLDYLIHCNEDTVLNASARCFKLNGDTFETSKDRLFNIVTRCNTIQSLSLFQRIAIKLGMIVRTDEGSRAY